MKISQNIAISENGFMFNPATGDSFSTNETGKEIIRLLQEGKNQAQILDALENHFATDRASLEKDLADFLYMLGNYRILDVNKVQTR
jgi:hypothetical protein